MLPATILFLAANPDGTPPLELDEEARALEGALEAARLRDELRFVSKWATRVGDLQQHLLAHSPTVVHLSCHGNTSGGILLHSEQGTRQSVAPAAMAGLFQALRDNVRLVVFNACHSLTQAEAVVEFIDCVVCMNDEIGDEAARVFAAAFYRALGFGRSVGEAFALGINALDLATIPEAKTPRLLMRPGVDPSKVWLRRGAPARSGSRVALIAAPDDEAWLKKLRVQLQPLANKEKFEVWDPSKVPFGGRRHEAVAEGFAGAAVVVVLASSWLLADEEFTGTRLPGLVARADAGSVRLLSLVVGACDIGATALDLYRPLNDPARPLELLPPPEQNQQLLAAAKQIAAALR